MIVSGTADDIWGYEYPTKPTEMSSFLCLIYGPTLAFLVICDNKACISQKLMVHTRENINVFLFH